MSIPVLLAATAPDSTQIISLTPLATSDAGAGLATQTVSTSTGSAAAPSPSQPGTVATANQAATSGPAISAVSNPVSDAPNYEFADASLGYGRYFTATQARMYIGNLFVEELAGCQWVFQENQVPIYGYASELFDAVGNGRLLAQGQLMVHFISEGYMYTVLNEVQKRSAGDGGNSAKLAAIMKQVQQLQALGTLSNGEKQQLTSLQVQYRQLLASDPTLASSYKRIANATTATSPNPLRRKVPFDIHLEYEGGGRTVKRKLLNCILTSNEMINGDNDSPLTESYGFIAREVR